MRMDKGGGRGCKRWDLTERRFCLLHTDLCNVSVLERGDGGDMCVGGGGMTLF